MEPLKAAFGDYFNQLELVEADLTNNASLVNAAKGCTYIVHTASPVPTKAPKNAEKEIIRPAVDGTTAIMQAAH